MQQFAAGRGEEFGGILVEELQNELLWFGRKFGGCLLLLILVCHPHWGREDWLGKGGKNGLAGMDGLSGISICRADPDLESSALEEWVPPESHGLVGLVLDNWTLDWA